MSDLCRHCKTKKVTRPRGLCWTCSMTPGVKEQYPSQSKYAPKWTQQAVPDLTTEEIEQMVAEQMANLPPWWHASHPLESEYGAGERQKQPDVRLPRSLKRGRVAKRLG